MVLQRPRHGGRGLAGADDDGAALRRRGQMRRHAKRGLRGGDRGVEHAAQQQSRVHCAVLSRHWSMPWPAKLFKFGSMGDGRDVQ